jgi:hypothetical protein
VWTGRVWAEVEVAEVALRSGEKVLSVGLDDGSGFECSQDHPWALVVQPRIMPVPAAETGLNHFSAPHHAISTADLGGTHDPRAYVRGRNFGSKLSERRRGGGVSVPEKIFGYDSESLGLFLAGWADGQNGSYFGPRPAVRDLKVLLCRAGVCSTSVGDLMGDYRSLSVGAPDGGKIPNPANAMRRFREMKEGRLPRIASVGEVASPPARLYTVRSTSTRLFVANGALTIC